MAQCLGISTCCRLYYCLPIALPITTLPLGYNVIVIGKHQGEVWVTWYVEKVSTVVKTCWAVRRNFISLDAVAMIQFLPCRTFTETLWAIKWFAVVTFTLTFRAVCDNDPGFNWIEDLAHTLHGTRQAMEVFTARSPPQGFFHDWVLHTFISKEEGLEAFFGV